MTEKESRIEKALFDLIQNAGPLLRVLFTHADSREKESEKGVRLISDDSTVYLTLMEPKSNECLDKWAEAIVKAEELVDSLKKERIWACTNPNFFKAIKAKHIVKTKGIQ